MPWKDLYNRSEFSDSNTAIVQQHKKGITQGRFNRPAATLFTIAKLQVDVGLLNLGPLFWKKPKFLVFCFFCSLQRMTKNLALPRHLLEKLLTDGHFVDEKYKVTRRPTYSRQNASLRRPSIVSGKRQSTKCRSAEWFSTRRRGAKLARSRKTDRKGYPTSFFLFYRWFNYIVLQEDKPLCSAFSRGTVVSFSRKSVREQKFSIFFLGSLQSGKEHSVRKNVTKLFSLHTL